MLSKLTVALTCQFIRGTNASRAGTIDNDFFKRKRERNYTPPAWLMLSNMLGEVNVPRYLLPLGPSWTLLFEREHSGVPPWELLLVRLKGGEPFVVSRWILLSVSVPEYMGVCSHYYLPTWNSFFYEKLRTWERLQQFPPAGDRSLYCVIFETVITVLNVCLLFSHSLKQECLLSNNCVYRKQWIDMQKYFLRIMNISLKQLIFYLSFKLVKSIKDILSKNKN